MHPVGGRPGQQHASVLWNFQATGVEPGSQSTVTGARPAGQDSGKRVPSTSGRPGDDEEQQSLLERITAPFKAIAMRGTIYTSFIFAKQPKRIRQVRNSILLGRATVFHVEQIYNSGLCSVLWRWHLLELDPLVSCAGTLLEM